MKPAASEPSLRQQLEDFILASDFPCIGAKAALAQNLMADYVAEDIQCGVDDLAIHAALLQNARKVECDKGEARSFVVLFRKPGGLDEMAFEDALWHRLAGLAAIDRKRGIAWSNQASNDPTDPHYAMSVGGASYFVVGLNPNASRSARRFSHCAMVFNAHAQFDVMRIDGRYQRFEAINRARELGTYGSLNPMLGAFGETSEARQYSGRAVSDTWKCPIMEDNSDD